MGESILFPWPWSVCFFGPHLPVIFLFRTGHLVCVLFTMLLWPNLSINMWHLMSAGLQGSHYGQWIWAWQRILGLRYLITSGFTFSLPTRWATHLPSNYIAGLFPNPVFRVPFDPLASLCVFPWCHIREALFLLANLSKRKSLLKLMPFSSILGITIITQWFLEILSSL